MPSLIARLRNYQRTHGVPATLRRGALALRLAATPGRMVLFACELPVPGSPPATGALERKKTLESVSAVELARLVFHWNPDTIRRLMTERFAANAELWLLREQGKIAAYGWTLKEKTMESHYYPLQPGDVHLFDFFVFPEFRGRGLNPALVGQILGAMGRDGMKRALIEAASWNTAQLASLKKTTFRQLGVARKSVLGKAGVVWSDRSGN